MLRVSAPSEEENAQDRKPTGTVRIQPRLGSLVFCDVEGTVRRAGVIKDILYLPPKGEEPFKIRYEFENTGNADILLSGEFFVLDHAGALVVKNDLTPIRLFPADRGSAETEWSGSLEPGTYHAIVHFELGPDAQEVIVREHDFIVPEDE